MGFLDEAGELAKKAEQEAKAHPDQVHGLLEKAEHLADQATGGAHDSEIASAEKQIEGFLKK